MRIVKPLVIIEDDQSMLLPNGLTLAEHSLRKIELFARTCYKSEGKMTDDTYKEFIPRLLRVKKHEGIIDHRFCSIRLVFDRGVSHEGVRHRMAAYLQESTRYCDYSLDGKNHGVTFVLPPWVQPIADGEYGEEAAEWVEFVQDCRDEEKRYNKWRARGWKPEQARGWLPHFVKTEYVDTKNYRSWMNFALLRANKKAHPSMQQVAIPVVQYLKAQLPQIFESVEVPEFAFGTENLAKVVVNPYYDQVEPETVYSD